MGAAPASAAVPAPPPAVEAGEFTRLLKTQTGSSVGAAPGCSAAAPAPPPAPEAGEFTRLLKTQAGPSSGAAPTSPLRQPARASLRACCGPNRPQPSNASQAPLHQHLKLENSRDLLRTQAGPPAGAGPAFAPPPAPPPDEPGEFTRLLKAQAGPLADPAGGDRPAPRNRELDLRSARPSRASSRACWNRRWRVAGALRNRSLFTSSPARRQLPRSRASLPACWNRHLLPRDWRASRWRRRRRVRKPAATPRERFTCRRELTGGARAARPQRVHQDV